MLLVTLDGLMGNQLLIFFFHLMSPLERLQRIQWPVHPGKCHTPGWVAMEVVRSCLCRGRYMQQSTLLLSREDNRPLAEGAVENHSLL